MLQNGLYTMLKYPVGTAAYFVGLFMFACVLVGYLFGSINSAVVVSRIFYGDDIRRHGSGNAGLTNTLRTYGKKAAGLVLAGDVLKTVLAILAGGLLMGVHYIGAFSLGQGGYLAALGCVLGHVFPVYYKFKGGKGVLCAAAAVLTLSPVVFAIMLAIFVILVAFTKYVSLGSVTVALTYPLFFNVTFMAWFGGSTAPSYIVLFTMFVALFVTWLHRANIKRLWNGEESKLSFSSKPKVEKQTDATDGDAQ